MKDPGHDRAHREAAQHEHATAPKQEQDHGHEHEHEHEGEHVNGHGHEPTNNPGHQHVSDHQHPTGFFGRLKNLVAPHSHDAADAVDSALETSGEGLRCLSISFAVLLVTAILQGVAVAATGSVALLGDSLHNLADALTAVPLAIAFTVGRRAATSRYTYGYGRAEDLAGVTVVLFIATSSVIAAYEAIHRLMHPHTVHALALVAIAGSVGFVGNEFVARYRIRVGKKIGSAALVADGLHARTDGFTSLAVVVGAAGLSAGIRIADPLVGLFITLAILLVLRSAIREIYRRLMDAVEPALVDRVRTALLGTPGVLGTGLIRVRWIGHTLRAECEIVVDYHLSVVAAHNIAEDARHRLLHDVPRLTAALVHADPSPIEGQDHHESARHHEAHD